MKLNKFYLIVIGLFMLVLGTLPGTRDVSNTFKTAGLVITTLGVAVINKKE